MSYAQIHGSKSRQAYNTGSAIVGSAPYGNALAVNDGYSQGYSNGRGQPEFQAVSRRYDARGSYEYGSDPTDVNADALTREFNRFAGGQGNGSTGMSMEFASAASNFHESPVRPSMEFAAGGSGTPPAHTQTSLSLLKKKMSRSGSKSKLRGQRSFSAQRRSDPPAATGATLHRSNSSGSMQESNGDGSTQKCTRQSGCVCSQCQADNAFKALLRGDDGGKRKAKARIQRPEWNNDFAAPIDQATEPNIKENVRAGSNAAPRGMKKRIQKRPPWNSDFASSEPAPQVEPERPPWNSDFASSEPRPEPGPEPERPPWNSDFASSEPEPEPDPDPEPKQAQYYDKMRAEMGGKRDFMDQMDQRGSSQGRTARNVRAADRKGPAVAAYRGIYRPGDAQGTKQEPAPRISHPVADASSRVQNYPTEQPKEQPTDQPTEQPTEAVVLFPCPDCGRKFNKKALARHQNICRKVFQQKRKAFDASKARLSEFGGQDKQLVKSVKKAPARRAPKGKSGKWKRQSEALREAMRANKIYAQAEAEGKPLPPMSSTPTVDPDLVPCPHCGRSFNETAAARHIPRCRDIKAKPKRLMKGSGRNSASTARSRR